MVELPSAPRGRATVAGAAIGAYTERPQVSSGRIGVDTLADQFADHGDETRIGSHGGYANETHLPSRGPLRSLGVEVVENLDVVGDEADRNCHHGGDAAVGQCFDVVADVGAEPRHRGWAASALEDEIVFADTSA